MRTARISGVLLAAALAVGGALLSVVLAEDIDSRVNQLAITLVVLAYTCVAAVIMLSRPGQLVGRLMFFGAVAWGVGEGALALGIYEYVPGSESTADASLVVFGSATRGMGWLVLILAVAMVFPDGRTAWPGRRFPLVILTAAIGVFTTATLLSPNPLDNRASEMDSPTGLPDRFIVLVDLLAISGLVLATAALAIAIAGQLARWRRGSELERQQLLWFAAAFAMPLLFLPLIATTLADPWMFALVTIPVPVAVAVALFQRRLYDVQLVVSQTLTYVALSAAVAALYAITVGGVGALLRERGAPWLPWVAAGVIAVTFAPLRNTLQRAVNRLTYGQWSQPADVLAATGRRLADASDVPGLLHTLTRELATGLGLDHVEISDIGGRELGSHGTPAQVYDEFGLTAYGAPVGVLRWSRQRLRAADRRLLEDVARQLGGVVHAASLFDAVRDAQERLVLAREEERRRLRRDLHDGLGPALASLTLQVDTLRNRLGNLQSRPNLDLDAELLTVRAGIQSTVLDVRRIVEGLRPPALDELGLEAAIEQLGDRLTRGTRLVVDVTVSELPPIPAAVEVAIYRVAQEALTNIVHHAVATRASVRVALADREITLEITDNGSGRVTARPGGVGLTSMRERAEEINGTLHIRASPGKGTTVAMSLPLAEHATREVAT